MCRFQALSLGFDKIKKGFSKTKTIFDELEDIAKTHAAEDSTRLGRVREMRRLRETVMLHVQALIKSMDPILQQKESTIGRLMNLHYEAKRAKRAKQSSLTPSWQKEQQKVLEQLETKYFEAIDEERVEATKASLETLMTLTQDELKSIEASLKKLAAQQSENEEEKGKKEEIIQKLKETEATMKWWGYVLVGASVVCAAACFSPLVALAAPIGTGLVAAIATTGVAAGGVAVRAHVLTKVRGEECKNLQGKIDNDASERAQHERLQKDLKDQHAMFKNLHMKVTQFEQNVKESKNEAVAFQMVIEKLDAERPFLAEQVQSNILTLLAGDNVGTLAYQEVTAIAEARYRLNELRAIVFKDLDKDYKVTEESSCVTSKSIHVQGPDPMFDCFHQVSRGLHSLCSNTRSYTFVNISPYSVRMGVYERRPESVLMKVADATASRIAQNPLMATPERVKPEVVVLKPGQEKTVEKNCGTIYVNAGVQHWGVSSRHEYYHMFWDMHQIEWTPRSRHLMKHEDVCWDENYMLKEDVYTESKTVEKKGFA